MPAEPPTSWLGVCLPQLPLDVHLRGCTPSIADRVALAICDHHAVLFASDAALERGIRPGMPKGTAQALVPDLALIPRDPAREQAALHQAGCWALQFTPRVSLRVPLSGNSRERVSLTGSGILLEIGASLRLFGGRDALIEKLRSGLGSLGFHAMISGAPNPSAAWLMALWQDGIFIEDEVRLRRQIASLPVSLFEEAGAHLDALASIGVRTAGDLLRLPRAGIAHRFGKHLLDALDRALGRTPEPRNWFEAPAVFEARLELFAQVENAEALMFGAGRLISELTGWLRARHAATRAFEVAAEHDEPPATLFQVRLAAPVRTTERMADVLGEVLSSHRLRAPAHTLRLRCEGIEPLPETSTSLFPTPEPQGESLGRLIERLQARLGREQVQRLLMAEDHRPEAAYRIAPYEPATGFSEAGKVSRGRRIVREKPGRASRPGIAPDEPCTDRHLSPEASTALGHRAGCLPRPIWFLPRPIPITERNNRPFWRGPLTLLAGPERIESGWWDGRPVQRDYFIATDEADGLLWIYRERRADDETRDGWFIQGRFG